MRTMALAVNSSRAYQHELPSPSRSCLSKARRFPSPPAVARRSLGARSFTYLTSAAASASAAPAAHFPPEPPSVTQMKALTSATASISAAPAAHFPPDPPSVTQKKVLVPMGLGCEEISVVVIVDILRRAGADVVVASIEQDLVVEASRRVKLVADEYLSSCAGKDFDLIALPGGMPGAARLQASQMLKQMTIDQVKNEKLVGGICATPAVALHEWGLLLGRKATCHPAFADKMSPTFMVKTAVEKDGPIITSRGAGTSFEFALLFVELLYGQKKYEEVSKPLVLRSRSRDELAKDEYRIQSWKVTKVPRVLVPIANGSEEMEAVIIVDVLRRAGMSVVLASVEDDVQIEASRNFKIVADKLIKEVESSTFDIIVLPGGMPGAERLRDNDILKSLIQQQIEAGKPLGAICAAPAVILQENGWLKGKKATCHPAFVKKLSNKLAAKSRVVIDEFIITSRGPGTAIEFALAIVEKVSGKERAASVARGMVFQYP